MKDAVLTVRVPGATRRRLERMARDEKRSLSQLVDRLISQGMSGEGRAVRRPRALAGALRRGVLPTLADFRSVRRALTASVARAAYRPPPEANQASMAWISRR
jgi:hypothetical protein